MIDKPRRSWQRRVLSLLIIVCIGWLFYVQALSLMAWHFARDIGQRNLNLEVVPRALPDTSIAEPGGVRVDRFGFTFRVPWKEVINDRPGKSVAILGFKDGGVLVFNPETEVDAAKIMRGTTADAQKKMNEVFGARMLSSNYLLTEAGLKVVPSDVKWWASRYSNTRNTILLANKSLNVGDAKAIYRISASDLRGFQYGDPSVAPYRVKLDLFDQDDRHYKLMIAT